MKKLFFGMLAFVSVFATSCQKEVPEAIAEEAMVTFNVGTPEIATRAYSDGLTATNLQYAVYDAEGKELTELTVTDGYISGSTAVKLQLTTGNTYSVIFWAAAPNAPYTVDFDAKTMTVDYTNAVCNDEARDAFYACETFTVVGPQTKTIELRRPFAQLNIGTNDYADTDKAGFLPTQSQVVVKSIYNTLNLVEGTVENLVDVTFAYNAIDTTQLFPVDGGYKYLAMNYLLVAADKEVVDVEFSYSDGADAKTRTVGSVPVQRNHRTNIYGAILTSTVDINVEIKPDFDEDDYAAAELFTVAAFGGKVTLTEDLVLTSPLIIQANATIDLNGYSIKGGKPDSPEATGTDIAAITVDNGASLTIEGEGAIEGTEYGVYAKNGNVTIKGGDIKARTSAVQVYRGIVEIENGQFSSTITDKRYTINSIDATWKSGEAKIFITGGRFFQFNPADNAAEGQNTNFVAEGHTSKADGDWFVVSEIVPEVYIANAEDFENAINSGADKIIAVGDIIFNNINLFGYRVYNCGSLTIDMGKYSFSNGDYAIDVQNTQLTLNGGNFIGGIQVQNGAHMTFNGGSINVETLNTSRRYVIAVDSSSKVEINGGEFSFAKQDGKRYYIYALSGSKVYVKGGVFGKASSKGGEFAAGISGSKEDVIITGGTFGFDPTTWVAEGYEAVKSGSTWTVVAQ